MITFRSPYDFTIHIYYLEVYHIGDIYKLEGETWKLRDMDLPNGIVADDLKTIYEKLISLNEEDEYTILPTNLNGPLYERCVKHATMRGRVSITHLQKEFNISYARAADIMCQMSDEGLIDNRKTMHKAYKSKGK